MPRKPKDPLSGGSTSQIGRLTGQGVQRSANPPVPPANQQAQTTKLPASGKATSTLPSIHKQKSKPEPQTEHQPDVAPPSEMPDAALPPQKTVSEFSKLPEPKLARSTSLQEEKKLDSLVPVVPVRTASAPAAPTKGKPRTLASLPGKQAVQDSPGKQGAVTAKSSKPKKDIFEPVQRAVSRLTATRLKSTKEMMLAIAPDNKEEKARVLSVIKNRARLIQQRRKLNYVKKLPSHDEFLENTLIAPFLWERKSEGTDEAKDQKEVKAEEIPSQNSLDIVFEKAVRAQVLDRASQIHDWINAITQFKKDVEQISSGRYHQVIHDRINNFIKESGFTSINDCISVIKSLIEKNKFYEELRAIHKNDEPDSKPLLTDEQIEQLSGVVDVFVGAHKQMLHDKQVVADIVRERRVERGGILEAGQERSVVSTVKDRVSRALARSVKDFDDAITEAQAAFAADAKAAQDKKEFKRGLVSKGLGTGASFVVGPFLGAAVGSLIEQFAGRLLDLAQQAVASTIGDSGRLSGVTKLYLSKVNETLADTTALAATISETSVETGADTAGEAVGERAAKKVVKEAEAEDKKSTPEKENPTYAIDFFMVHLEGMIKNLYEGIFSQEFLNDVALKARDALKELWENKKSQIVDVKGLDDFKKELVKNLEELIIQAVKDFDEKVKDEGVKIAGKDKEPKVASSEPLSKVFGLAAAAPAMDKLKDAKEKDFEEQFAQALEAGAAGAEACVELGKKAFGDKAVERGYADLKEVNREVGIVEKEENEKAKEEAAQTSALEKAKAFFSHSLAYVGNATKMAGHTFLDVTIGLTPMQSARIKIKNRNAESRLLTHLSMAWIAEEEKKIARSVLPEVMQPEAKAKSILALVEKANSFPKLKQHVGWVENKEEENKKIALVAEEREANRAKQLAEEKLHKLENSTPKADEKVIQAAKKEAEAAQSRLSKAGAAKMQLFRKQPLSQMEEKTIEDAEKELKKEKEAHKTKLEKAKNQVKEAKKLVGEEVLKLEKLKDPSLKELEDRVKELKVILSEAEKVLSAARSPEMVKKAESSVSKCKEMLKHANQELGEMTKERDAALKLLERAENSVLRLMRVEVEDSSKNWLFETYNSLPKMSETFNFSKLDAAKQKVEEKKAALDAAKQYEESETPGVRKHDKQIKVREAQAALDAAIKEFKPFVDLDKFKTTLAAAITYETAHDYKLDRSTQDFLHLEELKGKEFCTMVTLARKIQLRVDEFKDLVAGLDELKDIQFKNPEAQKARVALSAILTNQGAEPDMAQVKDCIAKIQGNLKASGVPELRREQIQELLERVSGWIQERSEGFSFPYPGLDKITLPEDRQAICEFYHLLHDKSDTELSARINALFEYHTADLYDLAHAHDKALASGVTEEVDRRLEQAAEKAVDKLKELFKEKGLFKGIPGGVLANEDIFKKIVAERFKEGPSYGLVFKKEPVSPKAVTPPVSPTHAQASPHRH